MFHVLKLNKSFGLHKLIGDRKCIQFSVLLLCTSAYAHEYFNNREYNYLFCKRNFVCILKRTFLQ